MKRRILGGILSIVMVVTVLPVGAIIAGAVEGDSSKGILDDSFDAFSEGLANIVNEYDEKEAETEERAEISTNSVEDDEENEFNLKRLIVKTKNQKALDDLGAIAKVEGFWNLHILQYATEAEAESAYNEYSKMSNVKYVEPDREVSVSKEEERKEASDNILSAQSNNSSGYFSWGAEAMGIAEYKEYLEETVAGDLPLITVAVVDTGIDTDHEMFGGYYDAQTNPDGRIMKTGKDFANNDNDPEDDIGHGTHVSGTITELTEENVKILPVKVLDKQGTGSLATVCVGMIYAAEHANIINMSLGGGEAETIESFLEEDIVNEQYENGVTFVVSAGNDNMNAKEQSPAKIEKCITVAAVDETMKKAEFSNYGDIIDITAPGVNIMSAKMGGGYVPMDGTSMATPHVAALAALLRTKDNSMDARELEAAIKDNVYDLGTEGFDKLYGYGFAYAKPGEDFSFIDIGFNKEPKEYANTIELSITSSDTDADIYYTLDGTYPDLNSEKYNRAITIDRTSSVRAIAYNQNNRSIFLSGDFYIKDTEPRYTIKINNDGTIVKLTGIIPSELTIPAEINGITVKEIGNCCFSYNHRLTKVTLPDTVKKIGSEAFFYCDALETINLENVEQIGNPGDAYGAFEGCTSLEKIDISSVKEIYEASFYDCFSLQEIGENNILENLKDLPTYAFSYCKSLQSISLPKAEIIGYYAFADSGIVNINAPKVVKVSDGALSHCIYLESINLPNVEEIGVEAFWYCELLKTINLPKAEKIYYTAFEYCILLETVNLSNAKEIGWSAFKNCHSLETINLPNAEKIEGEAFFNSRDLKEINIPKVVEIGMKAFSNCSSLKKINTDNTLDAVKVVNEQTFYKCKALETINLPKVTTIYEKAFAGCVSLREVEIPEVNHIGDGAFLRTDMKSISLQSDSWYIGEYALGYTFKIETVLIESENGNYYDTVTKYIPVDGFEIYGYNNRLAEEYAIANGFKFININGNTDFTVTFACADENGSMITIKTTPASRHGSVTPPDAPRVKGYTFTGWESSVEGVTLDDITSDVTFIAQYEKTAIYNWNRLISFFSKLLPWNWF